MHRRTLITLSAMTLTLLAGCGDRSSGPSGNNSTSEAGDASEENGTTETDGTANLNLVEISVPERIEQPEGTITMTATFENTGDGSGLWEGVALLVDSRGEGDASIGVNELRINIDPSETKTIEREFSVSGSGIMNFTLTGGSDLGTAFQKVVVAPSDPSPQIQFTNLVSDWEQFGDAASNVIYTIEPDTEAGIATRYLYWTETGVLDARFEYRLYDSSGNQLAVFTDETDRLTDQEGWTQWERWDPFITPSEAGEYTAEVLIRDRVDEATSDSGGESFDVEG